MTQQSTRLQIIKILGEFGPQTVEELTERVGVKQGTVRHHLTALRADGLVGMELKRNGVGRPAHVFSLVEHPRKK